MGEDDGESLRAVREGIDGPAAGNRGREHAAAMRCQECRYGLLHWHCQKCSQPVDQYGKICSCCRSPWDGWLGMAALIAAILFCSIAFYGLHDLLLACCLQR